MFVQQKSKLIWNHEIFSVSFQMKASNVGSDSWCEDQDKRSAVCLMSTRQSRDIIVN